jgi:hypothetical protein
MTLRRRIMYADRGDLAEVGQMTWYRWVMANVVSNE